MTNSKPTLRAYVLDDEVSVGTVVCHMLVASGFNPLQFTSAVPFLNTVKASPPDLVVLDLALGKSDAIDVMRQLEVVKYTGRAILISGHSESTLAEFTEIGERHGLLMLQPLKKPFRIGDLKSRLAAPQRTSQFATPLVSATPLVPVDLGEALRNRWLELWYQPKIDLKSLSVCGAEALLRARHPDHGIVSPAQLLPPAGDPLYHPLTNFVIGQAMIDWGHFDAQNLPIKLAVNVPVSVLMAAGFINVLREWLPKDPNFPGLILEITEDEVIRDVDTIREIATQLGLYKIRISIDDFGTAYSSFARLRELPFCELKLDQSFVSGCNLDATKRALCRAAIELAHEFGASACAEGIENAADLRSLIEMGCDTAQGFLFAKPMSFDKFMSKMKTPVAPLSFALAG